MEPGNGIYHSDGGFANAAQRDLPRQVVRGTSYSEFVGKKILLVVGLYNWQNQRINVVNQKNPIFFRLSDRYYYE